MPRARPPSASSGWEWNSQSPAPDPSRRGPPPRRRGSAEAIVAGVVFFGLAGLGVAAYVFLNDDSETQVPTEVAAGPPEAKTPAETPEPPTAPPKKKRAPPPAAPPSLAKITWTLDEPSTINDLIRTWAIPGDVLKPLNPKLAPNAQLEAGTKVVVHAKTIGASVSIGPPNDGRLSRGVPLPEGDAWRLPEDRNRAFGTTRTITAVTAALHAYAVRFPDADPIQVGDLSVRRGGKIYGHQSHQTGLDVDIRLIKASAEDGDFDAERNWFLVKTLVDGTASEVRSIFLNRTEQEWLRAAAQADVGVAGAERYFALISHERGHTIHMHVRFACSKLHKRCVGYSLPDTDEDDPKNAPKQTTPSKRLPSAPGGKSKKGPRLVPKSSGGTTKKKKLPAKKKAKRP